MRAGQTVEGRASKLATESRSPSNAHMQVRTLATALISSLLPCAHNLALHSSFLGTGHQSLVPSFLEKDVYVWEPLLVSYRMENPPKPQNRRKKYHPDIRVPPTTGDRKNTQKCQKNTPKIRISYFFSFRGGIWKGISGSLFFVCCRVFWISGLSYAVAGQ